MFATVETTTVAAVNEILPVPLAANPIAGLSFVQVYVVPGVVAVKFTVVIAPPQVVTLAGWFTCAEGLTVIVKVVGVPEQVMPPVNVGVTVIVATIGAPPLLIAVKEAISPEPLAARPMDGVLLVQLNTVPGTAPENATAVVAEPLHKIWLVIALTVGFGFTVTVN